jgi:hypothetical protein
MLERCSGTLHFFLAAFLAPVFFLAAFVVFLAADVFLGLEVFAAPPTAVKG